jgi:hypothetical protein
LSPAGDLAVPSTSDTLDRFREKYHKEYEAMREFDPQRTMRSAARASRVVGDVLEGYAETQRRLPKGGVVWFTRIAQLFWLLVEVAVPNSLASLVFRHGLKLLYFFEALAILLGTLLLYPTIQQFGFVAFAATAAVHGVVLFLEDVMSKKERGSGQRVGEKRWRSIAKYAVAILLALLAALGLIFMVAMLGLDLPQRFVGFMTGLPETANEAGPVTTNSLETTESTLGTLLRGAVMFVAVAVLLLATGREISRRMNR